MNSLLPTAPAVLIGTALLSGASLNACASPAPRPLTLRARYGIPRPVSLDPVRTALVLVDFQREFLDGGVPLPEAAPASDRALALLSWARERGLLVVFVRQLAAGPGPFFAPGSPGAELLAGFEPRADEWVVTKSAAGAFTRTDLARRLADRQVEQLIVAGFMTHLAVDSTARDATVLGLRVVVASDATATRSLPAADGGEPVDHRILQRAALAAIGDRFADVLSVDEIAALPVEPAR